jgi:hypothetical protein
MQGLLLVLVHFLVLLLFQTAFQPSLILDFSSSLQPLFFENFVDTTSFSCNPPPPPISLVAVFQMLADVLGGFHVLQVPTEIYM